MEDTPSATCVPTPQTEVRPRSGRRRFSLSYKRSIIEQLDACATFGEKAALLRREGLYSSYISKWRRQVASSDNSKPRGRPKLSKLERRVRELEAENDRLKRTLERTELAVEVQKKQ